MIIVFFNSYKSQKFFFQSIAPALIFLLSFFQVNSQKIKQDSIKKEIELKLSQKNFTPNDTTYINLLNSLAYEIKYYNVDSVLILSNQSLQLSSEINYLDGKIKAHANLGDYYADAGYLKKGRNHLKKAIEILNDQNTINKLYVDIKSKMSGLYLKENNFTKALNGYLECIELAKKIDYNIRISSSYEDIAYLFVHQKDYVEAVKYYKKVIEAAKKEAEPGYYAGIFTNLAAVYVKMNDLENAKKNIDKSIQYFEKANKLDWLGYAYTIRGSIYLLKNEFDESLNWLLKAENIFKNLDDERSEIFLYIELAKNYKSLKKSELAIKYGLRGYNLAVKTKNPRGIRESVEVLYKINKSENNFEEALAYHELHKKLSDSAQSIENQSILVAYKSKLLHDIEKKELIIKNEKALYNQKKYIYLSIFFLIIAAVIITFVTLNKRALKKINTELNIKKEALEESEKELKELNKTKDRLFSIIGHDLRGPIGAFKELLKLFDSGLLSKEELLGFVPRIKKDIINISFTLNNLLSWGQSQMKGSSIQPKKISLYKLIQENSNLLEEITHKKGITILNNVPTSVYVWADKNQIDVVIRNLMSNAIKFTPKNGKITLTTTEQQNSWQVEVSDNGIGMDKKKTKHLFLKNNNKSTYGTENEKGTGLGLILCKEMIEKNNGTIWVKSIPNKGSSFFFTLPKEKLD